jgi:hypothetical protein
MSGSSRRSMMLVMACVLLGAILLTTSHQTSAYNLDSKRRALVLTPTSRSAAGAIAAIAAGCLHPVVCSAAASAASPVHAPTAAPISNGLAVRLAKKDPSVLRNRIFNSAPPSAQVFPEWMRGSWKITSNLAGYIFPSRNISAQRLIKDYVVAGFQKCSIAQTADVGKENVQYEMRIDAASGLEDRVWNFQQAIDAYLGYRAVNQVLYNARQNPNRLSINFVDYRTINAERLELFCNARESESYTTPVVAAEDASLNSSPSSSNEEQALFVASEYVRQVTFGTGDTVGVPRQVVTNYGHFWTWKRLNDGNQIQGNLLTAVYLDPQDSLYFEDPTLPVVVYSHILTGERIPTV